jgi:hypothetical protein
MWADGASTRGVAMTAMIRGENVVFQDDSWSNWQPDPVRAFREHDPTLEPYASMSKDEILARMLIARGGREFEALREFLLDKCSDEERREDRFLDLLMKTRNLSQDEFDYLQEVATNATRIIPLPPHID